MMHDDLKLHKNAAYCIDFLQTDDKFAFNWILISA